MKKSSAALPAYMFLCRYEYFINVNIYILVVLLNTDVNSSLI